MGINEEEILKATNYAEMKSNEPPPVSKWKSKKCKFKISQTFFSEPKHDKM